MALPRLSPHQAVALCGLRNKGGVEAFPTRHKLSAATISQLVHPLGGHHHSGGEVHLPLNRVAETPDQSNFIPIAVLLTR